MGSTRDDLIVRMVQHVSALNKDLNEFHALARAWPKAAKAHQYLKLVQRDYQHLEAHVLALAAEIGHMDAVTRQFTGAGAASNRPRRVGDARTPSSTRVPQNMEQSRPTPDSDEPIPVPAHDDNETREILMPLVEDHNDPPQPEPEPETIEDQEPLSNEPLKKRLQDMAQDLPPHLLKELRKSGLE